MSDKLPVEENNLAVQLRQLFSKLSNEQIVDMVNLTLGVNGFTSFHIKHNETEIDGEVIRAYHVEFEKDNDHDS
jgi:hypothetical protein